MMLIDNKSYILKKYLKSHEARWLASKSAKDHLMSLTETHYISQKDREYAPFLAQFERIKRQHHFLMVRILSFLNLNEILTLSKVNRRLYIVTGDISLLKNFMHSDGTGGADDKQKETHQPNTLIEDAQ